MEEIRLYNTDKWLDICNDKKYQCIRDKITNSFTGLTFIEESHQYFLGDRELMCVSNVIHQFKEHFDSETEAQKTYERNFNNQDSKYYQMTPEEILEQWEKISQTACRTGTDRHNFGESCFYFMIGQYDKIVPEFTDRLKYDENSKPYMLALYPKEFAIVKFWQDLPRCIVPIAAENKVFNVNDDYAYSGTFDILFYYDALLDNKDDSKSGLMIFDYKTNVDLYKNFKGKRLLEPFNGLLDMDLSIYKLQLSAYQLCLENIGLNIIARRLIWLKPDGKYEKVPLESYTRMLDEALRNNNKTVLA